jgi:hypothetical protein
MVDAALIKCPVQVMSWLNAVLVEELRRSGERRGLAMLPVLHKPLRRGAVNLFARPLPKSEFAALLHQRGRGRAVP